MTEPSKRELEHAVRYATERTKIHLMDFYKHEHPSIFQFATMQTRPATSKDYYVPPSLADQCIVVTETKFERGGCLRAACFPFKENLEPCDDSDAPRWIPFGKHYTLACQPACLEKTSVDTYWQNETCYLLNPLKKMLAIFPETLFGNSTKHPLHFGLDWHDDHLRLNSDYCRAYGLVFDGDDCVPAKGQTITEMIFGKTVVRSFILPHKSRVTRPPPPPLPDYVHHKKRKTRQVEDPAAVQVETVLEIAKDLSVDFGIDVGFWLVKHVLTKKVPKLVARASSNVIFKSVLAQAVMKTYANVAIQAAKILGTTVGVMSNVFTVYSLVSVILDLVDPYTLDNVLDSATLKKIDFKLDLEYYQKEMGNNQEVTPEFMWDHVLNPGDESDRYLFMAEKVTEYIAALHSRPDTIDLPAFRSEQHHHHWHGNFQMIVIGILVVLTMVCWNWVHVWAALLFFILIWLLE